jgi:RNA polymerase-binding transcription factor DksA
MPSTELVRYSAEDLKEFEELLLSKLETADKERQTYINQMSRKDSVGQATTDGTRHSIENGAETQEKERLAQLAVRQEKFIINCKNALIRIKNGTYGVCSVTGKLIPKERLRAVPHTTQTIEAKNLQR